MFTTFVINLDKDKERMVHMHNQLKKLAIEYRRQSAILGKEYQPTLSEYDEELAIKKGGHKMLPGEVGCALSHAKVLEKIVQEKIPYALILEDDVVLPDNFKEIIEREIERNKKRWEYLSFDYVEVGYPFIRQWISGVKNNFEKLWKTKPLKGIAFLFYIFLKGLYIIPLSIFEGTREEYMKKHPGPVRFFRPVYFAGAYLISLSGAEKLYSLTKPVLYTADQLPNKARIWRRLRFRCFSPLIVSQKRTIFGSSILNLTGQQVDELFNNN